MKPYSRTLRWMHWLVAILVAVQLALGFAADWSPRPVAQFWLDQHVRTGILILALVLLRIMWRLARSEDITEIPMPAWQRFAARVAHLSLYLLLVAVTVSGYVLWAWIGRRLDWYSIFPIPILFKGGEDETWRSIAGYTHEYGVYLLIGLIVLHIGAALRHEFVLKDRLITGRMLGRH